MNLTEFNRKFGTEKKCIQFIKSQREKKGLICPKCSSKVTNWYANKIHWRCSCGRRIYLKSGTMMESTKLPYTTWFKAMYYMTFTKKPISILEMSRLLEIRRYRTVWYLTMKIRMAMSKVVLRNDYMNYLLLISGDKSTDPNLMGVQNFSVAAILKSNGKEKDKISLIAPIALLKNISIDESIYRQSGYRCLKIFGIQKYIHHKEAHFPVKKSVILWLRNLRTNEDRILNGIHHGVSRLHIQKYMLEYSFKYNRRYSEKMGDLTLQICT